MPGILIPLAHRPRGSPLGAISLRSPDVFRRKADGTLNVEHPPNVDTLRVIDATAHECDLYPVSRLECLSSRKHSDLDGVSLMEDILGPRSVFPRDCGLLEPLRVKHVSKLTDRAAFNL